MWENLSLNYVKKVMKKQIWKYIIQQQTTTSAIYAPDWEQNVARLNIVFGCPTFPKQMKVKGQSRMNIPYRHVHLTIIPYAKYSSSMAYDNWGTELITKTVHWPMNHKNKVKVRRTIPDNMFTVQSFHTHNIVVILLTVSVLQT